MASPMIAHVRRKPSMPIGHFIRVTQSVVVVRDTEGPLSDAHVFFFQLITRLILSTSAADYIDNTRRSCNQSHTKIKRVFVFTHDSQSQIIQNKYFIFCTTRAAIDHHIRHEKRWRFSDGRINLNTLRQTQRTAALANFFSVCVVC